MVHTMAGAVGESVIAIWGILSREDCLATPLVQNSDCCDADIIRDRTGGGSCCLVATGKDILFHNRVVQIANLVAAAFPFEHWCGTIVDGGLWILLLDIGMRWVGHLCCLVCDRGITAGSAYASVSDGHCVGAIESATDWFERLRRGRSQLLWLVPGGDWIITIFGAKSQTERGHGRPVDTLELASTDHGSPVMGTTHFVHDILAES